MTKTKMTTQEARKDLYKRAIENGMDPESLGMQQLRQQIMLDERQAHLDKLKKKAPERWHFLMQNPKA